MRTSTVYVLPANSQCQGDCCIHTDTLLGLACSIIAPRLLQFATLSSARTHVGCVAVTSFVQTDPIKALRCSLPKSESPFKVADLPSFLDQVLERFPLISDLSMMRNPACPGLMDVKRPDMEACRMYRTYVVFRAPQLVTVDGVDVTEEVSFG